MWVAEDEVAQVYAVELKQYAASPTGRLDEPGKFFVVAYDDANEIAGYVSITAPPNKPRLSKQVDSSDYAACVESLGPDASIYEFRSLTLLAVTHCEQAGVAFGPDVLTPELLQKLVGCLTFAKVDGKFDTLRLLKILTARVEAALVRETARRARSSASSRSTAVS